MSALTNALRLLLFAASCPLLVACEGLVTGEHTSSHALAQNPDGSFDPITLNLAPDMNPVAVNFKGMTVANQDENSRWNTYDARLARGDSVIATKSVTINNTGAGNNPQGGPFAHTLFFVTVPEAGEYRLTIVPTRTKEITIEEPRIEIRRNTQPPPQGRPSRRGLRTPGTTVILDRQKTTRTRKPR